MRKERVNFNRNASGMMFYKQQNLVLLALKEIVPKKNHKASEIRL